MKKLLSFLMILALLGGGALAEAVPAPEQVTQIILRFQETYPDRYLWSGEDTDFLQTVSDAAFGGLPTRRMEPVDYNALRPGDILRLKNDTYSVMILEKYDSHVTVVEVWTNGRVYWGRTVNKSAVEAGDYVMTRYPE
ncbi:MAG: hypothetical protein IJP78_11235 [Clostridia bacterium]|nr:hypothetical protein [Clostridia bacterium]MBQ6961539.1 hypothetical protein [Clostridia bacterium]